MKALEITEHAMHNATREPAQGTNRGFTARVREGQVMILFAVASIVLLAAVALSVDVGYLLAERRQVQAAADAAALAAAQHAMDHPDDTAAIRSVGEQYGALNVNDPEADVIVNPDAPGPPGGDAERYVEVSVTKEVEKHFLGVVYGGAWTTTATAMAAVEPVEANYALITLNPDASPGIYLNGNTGIVITGNEGSAASNSTIRGSNNTTFSVDGAIHAFGNIIGGSHWVNTAPLGVVPNRGRLVPDPIAEAGLTPPAKPTIVRDQDYIDDCLDSSPCELEPGLYEDVDIPMHKETINLQPGLFYFDGDSSFTLKKQSMVTGDGVLLYFAGSSFFDPKNGLFDVKSASLASDDDVVNHDDMVVWVDNENCFEIDLQGNGDMFFEGIFYAPCSHTLMHGNTTETIRGQLIVGSLMVKGGSALRIAYEQRAETSTPSVFLIR